MPRILTAAFVLGIASAGVAFAQTAPTASTSTTSRSTLPTLTSPAPSATAPAASSMTPGSGNTVGAPVSGANSFTEAQARRRIEKRGYSSVTGLAKDDRGIWRGKAMKGKTAVDVALDYKGNVVAGAAPGTAAKALTESDARRRVEAEGYTNVTGLKMDSHAMWRAKAMKAGKSVNLAIDDQGNVVTRK